MLTKTLNLLVLFQDPKPTLNIIPRNNDMELRLWKWKTTCQNSLQNAFALLTSQLRFQNPVYHILKKHRSQ